MNTATLGTWRKPPLAYVVAELAISPYYSMGAAMGAIQDKLRDAYPQTLEMQELAMDGAQFTPQPAWRLVSQDQRFGVHFGTRAIALHATEYQNSSDFLSRWADVLDAVGVAKLHPFVERAGLRYVDLIVPSEGHSPRDYLHTSLQGIDPEGATAVGGMCVGTFKFGDATVTARSYAPTPLGFTLPPDFNALPLTKPLIMMEAEARLGAAKPIGCVDTDCSKVVRTAFTGSALVDVYAELQKLASKTFQGMLSPLAQSEWK